MADIVLLTPGLTLLEAYQIAKDTNMHLIEIGGDVRISPIIPPGAREIPIKVKITAPDRGRVVVANDPAQVAA